MTTKHDARTAFNGLVIEMNAAFKWIDPGALSRQILALLGELEHWPLALALETMPAKPVNRVSDA
ncbi:hypothetical protein AB4089_22025 [Arthrobacter sp. 2MCAF15]|uniref:hypothetical protein n=1 Tax=Arthrobacter sp. 2MCAF15 TaxID=3232984 RepID=UPI003F935E56